MIIFYVRDDVQTIGSISIDLSFIPLTVKTTGLEITLPKWAIIALAIEIKGLLRDLDMLPEALQ